MNVADAEISYLILSFSFGLPSIVRPYRFPAMRKGIESWKQILTSVLLNELFHTEYVTRSYSFSLLFFFF